MKLFYIANNQLPTKKAHGLQIMKMCEAFAENGVDCELIIPNRVTDPALKEKDPFIFYGVRRNFKLTYLPSFSLIHWMSLPLIGRGLFFLQQYSFAWSVKKYLAKSSSDDVIYSRDPFSLAIIPGSRRLFWEVHMYPRNPRKYLYHKTLNKVEKLAVISGGLKDAFIKIGIPAKKIFLAPDGVDVTKFRPLEDSVKARRDLGLPELGYLIGYVGQLNTAGMPKGIQTLLESFRILIKSIPNSILCIVGGSIQDIQYYKNYSQKIGLSDSSIMFEGYQSPIRVPEYLAACDALVIPYPNQDHYAKFMSPLKLFEYMAAGRPIIASDLPALREIVSDREVILVTPDDPQALSQGFIEAKKGDVGIKVKNALDLVKKYTWHERARNILENIYG